MIIKDPAKSYAAHVSEEGRLQANAVMSGIEAHHSYVHGSTFTIFNATVTMDGNDRTILHFQNTSSLENFFLTKICFSHQDTSGTPKMGLYLGSAYSAGGAAFTPANLNANMSVTASATVYTGDNITVTGGTLFCAQFLPTSLLLPWDGSVVVGPNNTLHVNLIGTNTVEAAVTLRGFWSDEEF